MTNQMADRPRRRLVKAEELAAILAVPTSWVYQRTAADSIPVVRVGRYVRFDVDSVLRWLAAERRATEVARGH